jgi:hypothetical protein
MICEIRGQCSGALAGLSSRIFCFSLLVNIPPLYGLFCHVLMMSPIALIRQHIIASSSPTRQWAGFTATTSSVSVWEWCLLFLNHRNNCERTCSVTSAYRPGNGYGKHWYRSVLYFMFVHCRRWAKGHAMLSCFLRVSSREVLQRLGRNLIREVYSNICLTYWI